MYQNIFYDYFNQTIHLWDDEFGYHQLEHKPVAYLRDPEGEYETMNGIKCRKVTKWTEKTANSGYLYGHNVRPEVSMLIELYGDSDEISTNHCIAFIDIEVAKMKQHSTPQEARNPVTAISVYNTRDEKTVCFILDKEKKLKKVKYSGVDVHRFNTERELLDEFLNYWKELAPTIATGWNVLKYDFPYLYNRIERIYGRYQGNALSPINKVKSYTNKRGEDIFLIAGISILDYIELYKKFIPVESPSYTLDYIATKEIGRGKIKYTGDLSTLYETDIHKFIEYNIEDVKLVVDIDKKLDFIGIAMGICHAGHVPYEDFNFSSRFIEGAILTSLHRDGKIPMTKIYSENTKKAIGAFVKNPVPGIYKWVYDLDLRSLYPSIIMTLNISPETKVGKVLNWNPDNPTGSYTVIPFEYGVEEGEELIVENLSEFLKEYNIAIASNGMLYTKDYEGIIPKLISKWATQREEFRKLSDDAFHGGDMKTYNYYDRKQKIQKIFGNSIYGVTLLPPFRFYDRDNGEAVTVTGQNIIKHTATMANEFYSEATGNTLENSVIYCDTDSVAGNSIVNEKNIGDITISNLFDLFKFDKCIKDLNGREFVFPNECMLPFYDECSNTILYGYVKYIEKHLITKKRFKITTKLGKEIIVSEDHSIMVKENNSLKSKLTKDLVVGDIIITH
jgi:DNA polymerase elongation subunit (family B)